MSHSTAEIIKQANTKGILVPAFNIPYIPMMEPVVKAVRDCNSFALIEVARLEWEKFEAKGLKPIRDEFSRVGDENHLRLHLDHVPVIDEDNMEVDYLAVICEAVDLGYQSVMVDGSRLSLEENIKATGAVAEVAHNAGIPCEAELGAVLGHEAGPLPPYEEIFASGKGFTRVEDAVKFVEESECDWLSVAIGNIHGAVSAAARDKKKVSARLNIDHLKALHEATKIPLVLHGGSGIGQEYIIEAAKHGITKLNVGTEIRQAYEKAYNEGKDVGRGQEAVYTRTKELLKDYFLLENTRNKLDV
jgi:ketose-bisphosphate aldolase